MTHTWRTDPELVSIQAATLKDLLWWSFGLERDQIAGPGWMNTANFDVQAKTSSPTTDAEKQEALRPILVRAFHLQLRFDDEPRPVYFLQQAPGGAKLTRSSRTEPSINGWRTGYTGLGIRMANLATDLRDYVGRPVLDRTGLTGRYDVRLAFASPYSDAPATDPSIFAELNEAAGLRLVPARAPIQLLRIAAATRLAKPWSGP